MAHLGYTDTPVIPGSTYRVHDSSRPQPRVVTPPTASTQDKAGAAPSDAVILFDGSQDTFSNWQSLSGDACPWELGQGYMQVVPKSGDICSKQELGDCQLHLEFAEPEEIKGESQGRGNSGVFLMGMYEIQVLDCYKNPTYADGTTGAIYGQFPPLVNACREPGKWQSYDIIWIAPRFEDNKLVTPARVTVILNGVLVHHDQPLQGPTQHKKLAEYKPHGPTAPLRLQDHGDLVRFRNIWFRPLTGYDQE
jgi:hypothetical protein